jgi:hypothetical protein
MNFLFIIYLVGILIAVFQDFTRREIDDWLNLFIFSSGVLFLGCTENLFTNSVSLVTFGLFVFFVALLSLAFYYGRFFSGGDSKLFFALSPLFFTPFLVSSVYNLMIYIILLLVCGSIYSMFFSFYFFFKDFKKIKYVFLKFLNKKSNYILLSVAFILFLIGFIEKLFFLFSFFFPLFVFLICFAKSIEEVSMKRLVNTKNLREGDWLFSDIRIGKKLFKKNWDGLSEEDISYMKKFNKKVFIKDGIPYAPAFLFALILFEFREYLLGIIFS